MFASTRTLNDTTDIAVLLDALGSSTTGTTADLATEVTRAETAESILTTGLAYEVSRATGAEATLTTNLAAEVTRAQAAEATLTTNLAAEVTRATAAETTLTTNVATNTTAISTINSTLTGYGTQIKTNDIESLGSTLTVAGAIATTTLNLGTASAIQTLNIGTGSAAKTINLGGINDSVVVAGTTVYANTTNLTVTDKTITCNQGGAVATGAGSGLVISENGVDTGYILQNATRSGYILQASDGAAPINLTQSLSSTDSPTFVTVNSNLSGNATTSSSCTGNAATVTNGVYTTDTGTVTNTMLAGGIANSKLANTAVANLSGVNTGDQINITGNAATVTNGVYTTDIGTVTATMIAPGVIPTNPVVTMTGDITGTNTATVNPAKWIGDWNSATSYLVGNQVTRANNTYKCLVANTNSDPTSGTANIQFQPLTDYTGTVSTTTTQELGTAFTPNSSGWIYGIRFWKSNGATTTRKLTLWNFNTSSRIATAVTLAEAATGYISATFATPVLLEVGVMYMVSCPRIAETAPNQVSILNFANNSGGVLSLNAAYANSTLNACPKTQVAVHSNVDVMFQLDGNTNWARQSYAIDSTSQGKVNAMYDSLYSTTSVSVPNQLVRRDNNGLIAFPTGNITGVLLTGYSAAAGTITSTDTILAGINKLSGNIASASGVSTATANAGAKRDANADCAFRDLTLRRIKDDVSAGVIFDVDSAQSNVLLGNNCGNQTTIATGSNNTCVGSTCGTLLNGGYQNVLVGSNCGTQIVAGLNNVAMGSYALNTGDVYYNTAIGYGALGLQQTSSGTNTAVGYCAGQLITNGGSCALLGDFAGGNITTENNNTCVGSGANITAGNQNSTAIGYGAITTASNQIHLGNSSVTSVVTSGAITCSALTCTGVVTQPTAYFLGKLIGTSVVNLAATAGHPWYTIPFGSIQSAGVTAASTSGTFTVSSTGLYKYSFNFAIITVDKSVFYPLNFTNQNASSPLPAYVQPYVTASDASGYSAIVSGSGFINLTAGDVVTTIQFYQPTSPVMTVASLLIGECIDANTSTRTVVDGGYYIVERVG